MFCTVFLRESVTFSYYKMINKGGNDYEIKFAQCSHIIKRKITCQKNIRCRPDYKRHTNLESEKTN